MFNSKKDFALAMLAGRRFNIPNVSGGGEVYYDEYELAPFRYRFGGEDAPLDAAWRFYDKVTEIPPVKTLCWVSNVHPDRRKGVRYFTDTESNRDVHNVRWGFVTPVKPGDLEVGG